MLTSFTSTENDPASDNSALKIFGLIVNIFTSEFNLVFKLDFPAYMGRVAITSPDSTVKLIQSTTQPELSLTDNRGARSFPNAVFPTIIYVAPTSLA